MIYNGGSVCIVIGRVILRLILREDIWQQKAIDHENKDPTLPVNQSEELDETSRLIRRSMTHIYLINNQLINHMGEMLFFKVGLVFEQWILT